MDVIGAVNDDSSCQHDD